MRYVAAAASRLNEKIISGRAEKHLFFHPYYFICSVCVCGPRPPLSFPIFKLLFFFFFFLPILHCCPIETETNGLSCYMYVGVPGADRHRHKIDQTRYAPAYSLAPNPFFSSSFTRPNLCAAYVYTQRERKKRKP